MPMPQQISARPASRAVQLSGDSSRAAMSKTSTSSACCSASLPASWLACGLPLAAAAGAAAAFLRLPLAAPPATACCAAGNGACACCELCRIQRERPCAQHASAQHAARQVHPRPVLACAGGLAAGLAARSPATLLARRAARVANRRVRQQVLHQRLCQLHDVLQRHLHLVAACRRALQEQQSAASAVCGARRACSSAGCMLVPQQCHSTRTLQPLLPAAHPCRHPGSG